MPHQRWGNPHAVERTEPTYHDLLRENMRLRDCVEELEGGLKSAGEREAKAKLRGSRGAKSVSVQRFWIALVSVAGAFVCWWFVAK